MILERTGMDRRGFIRGAWKGKKSADFAAAFRPPWALPEGEFESLCDPECDACVTACEENILVLNEDRHARVNFTLGECTFCGACQEACPSGAISKKNQGVEDAFSHIAEVTQACLGLRGIDCRACDDACEPRAIRFKPRLGGKSLPMINAEKCTGCGACFGVCPEGAIDLSQGEFGGEK